MADNREELRKSILSCMADVLKQNGFPTEFFDGSDGNPPITRIELRKQGKVQQDVLLEMCFIPMTMPRPNTELFQMYATLLVNMPEKFMPELKRAVFYCNDFTPVGQFGVFEQAGQVYMRHNLVITADDDLERIVTEICDYFSLMLASIGRFVDALAQIASGATTIELARDMELLP